MSPPLVPSSWPWVSYVLALFAVVIGFLTLCEPAQGQPLAEAVGRLQPRLTPQARATWAKAIADATAQHGLDPYLVAAMVMRESSFRADVAEGRRRGKLGEVGPLQVHGVAWRFAPPGCTAKRGDARCWLQTGVNFLAHHRKACPGSTARWVASYAMRRCPSEATAKRSKTVRNARRWYAVAKGGVAW